MVAWVHTLLLYMSIQRIVLYMWALACAAENNSFPFPLVLSRMNGGSIETHPAHTVKCVSHGGLWISVAELWVRGFACKKHPYSLITSAAHTRHILVRWVDGRRGDKKDFSKAASLNTTDHKHLFLSVKLFSKSWLSVEDYKFSRFHQGHGRHGGDIRAGCPSRRRGDVGCCLQTGQTETIARGVVLSDSRQHWQKHHQSS